MAVHCPLDRPSEPQGNQCSIPHFLASLGEQKNWYCTNIAQQYCDQLTAVKTGYSLTSITWPYCGLGCRPVKLSVISFQMIAGPSLFFLIHMNCVYLQQNLNFEFKLTSDEKIQAAIAVRKDSCFWLLATATATRWSRSTSSFYALIGKKLTGKFKLVYFDSWSWNSFVSSCDVFYCLFPPDVQNEIQPLWRVFCYLWLICLLDFWLGKSLVKVGNPISDGIVFVFNLAWCVRWVS